MNEVGWFFAHRPIVPYTSGLLLGDLSIFNVCKAVRRSIGDTDLLGLQ
jgi:hypothetical protein